MVCALLLNLAGNTVRNLKNFVVVEDPSLGAQKDGFKGAVIWGLC